MDIVRLEDVWVDYNGTRALEGINLQVATHDVKKASGCNLVMLLARSVVAVGGPGDVLTPELLLKTLRAQILHD